MKDTTQILIVDDDELTRETFQDILQHEGYRVATAATAQAAIQKVTEGDFSLLLIDIKLPDRSGVEVLNQFKQLHPDSEAIMITGHASLENVLQTFEHASAYITKPVDLPELLEKIRRLTDQQSKRAKQQELQKQLEEELEFYRELSHTDPLTQIYNGRYFRRLLTEEVYRARRYRRSMVVLMMDVDQFKLYNDRHGHIDADDALVELARIFQKCKRESDLVARLGGEEFAYLLPEIDRHQGYAFAERVRQSVEECQFPLRDEGYGQLTLSIGIAEFPRDASEDMQLMRCADQALYAAKRAGRNQTRIYDAGS